MSITLVVVILNYVLPIMAFAGLDGDYAAFDNGHYISQAPQFTTYFTTYLYYLLTLRLTYITTFIQALHRCGTQCVRTILWLGVGNGTDRLGVRLVHAGGVEEHVLGVRYGRAGHAP